MNNKYKSFKHRLTEALNKHRMTKEDILPVDWFHLFKHCNIDYIINSLSHKSLLIRCNNLGLKLRSEANDNEELFFEQLENNSFVYHSFPMIDYSSFCKINETPYVICCLPVKTDFNGKTRFKIISFKRLDDKNE